MTPSSAEDRPPVTYDEFSAHPLAERRAIYSELSPDLKSSLWVEQCSRYRAAHSNLTEDQRHILDEFETFARVVESFERTAEPGPELDRLAQAAKAAFGIDEARRLFATLGPEEPEGSCRIRRSRAV